MYPVAAPDATLPRVPPPPWPLADVHAQARRQPLSRAAAPATEHDPTLLVAALEEIRKRDEALECLATADLLKFCLP